MEQFKDLGVVYDEGRKIAIKGILFHSSVLYTNFFCFQGNFGIASLEKITEEEKIAIENDYDPIEAPPGPFTIQPEKPGRYFKLMISFLGIIQF